LLGVKVAKTAAKLPRDNSAVSALAKTAVAQHFFSLVSGPSVSHACPVFIPSVRLRLHPHGGISVAATPTVAAAGSAKGILCQVFCSISAAFGCIALPTTNVKTSKSFYPETDT